MVARRGPSPCLLCFPGMTKFTSGRSAIRVSYKRCTWLAGGAKSQEAEGRVKRFLPFSSGTRDCVGQSLARMNYTATVAMLMAHFRFELADKVRSSCCPFAVKASLPHAMAALYNDAKIWQLSTNLDGREVGALHAYDVTMVTNHAPHVRACIQNCLCRWVAKRAC